MCFSQGLFVPFLRLSEPYFYEVIFLKCGKCCEKKMTEEEEDYEYIERAFSMKSSRMSLESMETLGDEQS